MGEGVFWGHPISPGDDASSPSITTEAVLSALRCSENQHPGEDWVT